jgi:hypothetical protein
MRLARLKWCAGLLAGVLLLSAAGCRGETSGGYQRRRMAMDLADVLAREAQAVEDPERRERLVTGLEQMRQVLVARPVELKPMIASDPGPTMPMPEGGTDPVPEWAQMFDPKSLVIGFFTQAKDFDGKGGPDGLAVRVQPIDQFGDPTKAVGAYRIEVFDYRQKSLEKRGDRLGHWFVSVLDAESNRKYYDPIDRAYVFPLLWDQPIGSGQAVVVQAIFYPPGGFDEKLIAQRVIRVGPE